MSDGILADYCDGVQCRQHPLFGKDHHALQIFLYYDDAEVVNPLGSSATIHKLGKRTMSCTYIMYMYLSCLLWCYFLLGFFYYTLGNLEPRLRSPTNAIQLVSIVKTSYIDKYGIDIILESFVQAIVKLESVS